MSKTQEKSRTILLIDNSGSMGGKRSETAEKIAATTAFDDVYYVAGNYRSSGVTKTGSYRSGAPDEKTADDLMKVINLKDGDKIVYITDEPVFGRQAAFPKALEKLGLNIKVISMAGKTKSAYYLSQQQHYDFKHTIYVDTDYSSVLKAVKMAVDKNLDIIKNDKRPESVIQADIDLSLNLSKLEQNQRYINNAIERQVKFLEQEKEKLKGLRKKARELTSEFDKVSAARDALRTAKPVRKTAAKKPASKAAK